MKVKCLTAKLEDLIRKILGLKPKVEAKRLTKWHRACIWLAQVVDGSSMALTPDDDSKYGTVVIIASRQEDEVTSLRTRASGISAVMSVTKNGNSLAFGGDWLQVKRPVTEAYAYVKLKSRPGMCGRLSLIDTWDEQLAKLVVTVIALKPARAAHDKMRSTVSTKLEEDGLERWGVGYGIRISEDWNFGKKKKMFPVFKSEEELFLRMSLDGFAIDEAEGKDAHAQV